MQPTEEQQRIVASDARSLVVEAGAGTAKTTTLGLYAGARPRSRILYLAFNKSIQLEAAERMPPNVTCRTTHSIAWRKAVGALMPAPNPAFVPNGTLPPASPRKAKKK